MFIDVGGVTTFLAIAMALATAVGWYLRRRETRANVWAATFNDMAATVDSLSSALDEERARRRAIEDELEELREGIRVLIRQLAAEPDWEPD
jgi:gamma-glutamyl:cysteine ligase YbdK (ATP-grasp superfamily)